MIVNKFRGDRAILEPGLKTLEDLCGIPVVGVIPYTHADIDEEDSLTERFDTSAERKLIDIAVIRLPRSSNFTDFHPFERYGNVSLRYVDSVGDLHQPDMIILPGTKSTMADLGWLRQCGLEAAIHKAADVGVLIFGVYGSYIHGVFDGSGITDRILKAICTPKGISFDTLETFDMGAYKELQYDLLADVVRSGLDMELIYRILNREVS